MPHVAAAQATEGGEVRVDYSGDHDQQADLLAALVRGGHRVIGLREEQADLEDVFLKLTTGAVQ
jgi:ABC-2 type transport system ATP-binding protein